MSLKDFLKNKKYQNYNFELLLNFKLLLFLLLKTKGLCCKEVLLRWDNLFLLSNNKKLINVLLLLLLILKLLLLLL